MLGRARHLPSSTSALTASDATCGAPVNTWSERTIGFNRGGWKSCGISGTPQDALPTTLADGLSRKEGHGEGRLACATQISNSRPLVEWDNPHCSVLDDDRRRSCLRSGVTARSCSGWIRKRGRDLPPASTILPVVRMHGPFFSGRRYCGPM
jgi:hypothetical protein